MLFLKNLQLNEYNKNIIQTYIRNKSSERRLASSRKAKKKNQWNILKMNQGKIYFIILKNIFLPAQQNFLLI